MRTILVPVDFSEHSAIALDAAALIAKKRNAELVVLHMMGISEAVISKNTAAEAAEAVYYMKLAAKRFAEFLDRPSLEGIRIKEVVQNHTVFSEVNKVAHENSADLIVMGSHGSSGLSEAFVGSNTEKVVRTSDIPVLVIKQPLAENAFARALFACSFEEDNVRPYLNALRFFGGFGSSLDLLYVNTPYNAFESSAETSEKIRKFFEKAGVPAPSDSRIHVWNDYSAEEGIFNFCREKNFNLIAIPTHGRKGLSHFFMGSIGEDVVNHAVRPVITFRI